MEVAFDAFAQDFNRAGLGQTGSPFNEHVAIGKDRDEQTVDEFFLSQYVLADEMF